MSRRKSAWPSKLANMKPGDRVTMTISGTVVEVDVTASRLGVVLDPQDGLETRRVTFDDAELREMLIEHRPREVKVGDWAEDNGYQGQVMAIADGWAWMRSSENAAASWAGVLRPASILRWIKPPKAAK